MDEASPALHKEKRKATSSFPPAAFRHQADISPVDGETSRKKTQMSSRCCGYCEKHIALGVRKGMCVYTDMVYFNGVFTAVSGLR